EHAVLALRYAVRVVTLNGLTRVDPTDQLSVDDNVLRDQVSVLLPDARPNVRTVPVILVRVVRVFDDLPRTEHMIELSLRDLRAEPLRQTLKSSKLPPDNGVRQSDTRAVQLLCHRHESILRDQVTVSPIVQRVDVLREELVIHAAKRTLRLPVSLRTRLVGADHVLTHNLRAVNVG